jgi:hypothetical protein
MWEPPERTTSVYVGRIETSARLNPEPTSTARASISHPMGFRGRYQATTSPTTAKDRTPTTFAPSVTSGSCRAASDSGTSATARSTVSPASTHASAGAAHKGSPRTVRASVSRCCHPGWPAAGRASLTYATLRPHRSGNVTAQHASATVLALGRRAGPSSHARCAGPQAKVTVTGPERRADRIAWI